MNGHKGEFTENRAPMPQIGERAKLAAGSGAFLPLCVKAGFRSVHAFLPAAGNRNGTSVNNVGSNGNYWSATYNNSNNAYNLNFNSGNVNPSNNNNRYNGQSVRLVRSAENCPRPFIFLFV
ncbi:MAG: hypothetical protein IJP95_03920 [Bacteroidales bacterium]|nr:hypothetical protein [Bacteroidales bacterium]